VCLEVDGILVGIEATAHVHMVYGIPVCGNGNFW